MIKYDGIIIGSGQAGTPLARKLSAKGWRIAIIEKEFVGGTCINVGCTPTKTLIASGRIAHLARRAADFGVKTGPVEVDIEAVVKRKNGLVLSFREANTKSLLETHDLDLIYGTASFTGPRELTVAKEEGSIASITANHIFINTGTKPVVPSISGLESVHYYDSSTIQNLLEIPRHLVIIGGGYIALEFGQLYRRLGSEVTVIDDAPAFLHHEDEDIAREIRKMLEEEGLRILTGVDVTQVSNGSGNISIELSGAPTVDEDPPGSTTIIGTHLLVATGRHADTRALQPEVGGVHLDEHGFIKVNDRLETSAPGVYALGDVKGGPQFTHISYNDHLVVYKNLIEGGTESIAKRPAIYCLFTDPELGRIGLTEKEARAKGLDIKVACLPAAHIARALENGETKGLVKAIVDAQTGTILGASVLTQGGGELMSILQMAMVGGITYRQMKDMIFAHPTFAECLNNLFAKID